MVHSIGRKLQQARLSKQLSLEEAARVTRIRPDKLLDLEEDNYTNFPSMSYAKGFLQIYGRFLGVDVREFTDHIHTPNPVSSDDYDYINAASVGPQPAPSRRPYHFSARREHTILPVVIFAALVGVVVLVIYVIVSFQRLPANLEDLAEKKDLSSPSPASAAISTLPNPPPPAPAAPTPAPVVAQATSVASPSAPIPAATPAETFDPTREVRRAEPVIPSTPPGPALASPSPLPPVETGPAPISAVVAVPSAAPDASAPPAPSPAPIVASASPSAATQLPEPIKQVSIRPLWKTRVTIRKDIAGSTPIFEDWLYPTDPPLKLKGRKFWIQVTDPGSVEVTQDGQAVPSGESDIQIE